MKEVLINIDVSKPNVFAGFKVKIKSQTKIEDESLTTNLPNPKTDKYFKITRAKAAPCRQVTFDM